MNMDQAAVFFAGSILVVLGIIVVAAGILAINNLCYTYWKPVKWLKYEYRTVYFDAITGAPLIEKEQKEPTLTTKDVK